MAVLFSTGSAGISALSSETGDCSGTVARTGFRLTGAGAKVLRRSSRWRSQAMVSQSPDATSMAQKKLREIRERALKDFDILELLIVHRYGEITIGENIVLIIAGAEHRADAFRACKWAIDELKQITPIWKLEHTPSGEVWVEEHP